MALGACGHHRLRASLAPNDTPRRFVTQRGKRSPAPGIRSPWIPPVPLDPPGVGLSSERPHRYPLRFAPVNCASQLRQSTVCAQRRTTALGRAVRDDDTMVGSMRLTCSASGAKQRWPGGAPATPGRHSLDTPGQPLFQFRPAPQRVAVGGADKTLHEACQRDSRYNSRQAADRDERNPARSSAGEMVIGNVRL